MLEAVGKIVRVDDAHRQRQRDDEHKQSQFPGIGEAPHDAPEKVLAAVLCILGHRFA